MDVHWGEKNADLLPLARGRGGRIGDAGDEHTAVGSTYQVGLVKTHARDARKKNVEEETARTSSATAPAERRQAAAPAPERRANDEGLHPRAIDRHTTI